MHVGRRSHTQHHRGRIILIQSGHGSTGQRCHPLRQRETDLTSVSLTIIRHKEAIVAPRVLVHRGDEVLLLHDEVTLGRPGVVVNSHLKEGSLCTGDLHLQQLPVFTLCSL